MTTMHEHEWVETGVRRTHFEDQPNSSRRHRMTVRVACACGWRGFRYGDNRIVYTWNPEDEG